MKGFIKIVDQVNMIVFNILAGLFGVMACLTLYQVFARYVLNSPLVWSEEVVRYLMIWIVLLGTAISLRKGLLISVEIVLHIVPSIVKKVMNVIIILLNIFFLFILIKYGFVIMDTLQGQRTGALDIPVAWTYASISVGSILAIINCVVVLIELFIPVEKGDKENGSTVIH